MDACTHQPMPNPELAPPAPAPAPPAAAQQEATGDSESDALVSAPTVGDRRPLVAAGYAEDDAESCSGAGCNSNRVPAASVDDDDGRGANDDVAMEGDENEEVDSRMSIPWWRRMVKDAADGAGASGGCARPQAAAAEGGAAAVVAGPCHTAESNRLFWDACIAHGY
ncbi:unnamed protein product [Miscanthus lutarioriparius]|uniref:Uncharacterized protein n=1 Tax=Miscanthus lutarioriparius TaxID=422564 RepID=A0A811RQR2_9POAL|nr:unnamed protein product [Miscanthus lutarioriparius]